MKALKFVSRKTFTETGFVRRAAQGSTGQSISGNNSIGEVGGLPEEGGEGIEVLGM